MIMKRDVSRKMAWHTWAVILLLGAVVLLVAAQTSGVDATSEQQASEPVIPVPVVASESARQKAAAGAASAPVPESPDPAPAERERNASSITESPGRFGDYTSIDAPEKSLEARIRRLELLVEKLVEAQNRSTAGPRTAPRRRSIRRASPNTNTFDEFANRSAPRVNIRLDSVSPDGKFATILTVGEKTSDIEIFDAASGRKMSQIKLVERATKLTFSDNRHLVVLLAGGLIRVVEVSTGKVSKVLDFPIEWPPSKIRDVPTKSRSAPAKPDRIRHESKGQRRLLELDVAVAELKLEAARAKQAATQKLQQTMLVPISILRQRQIAVQQARLDVERAKTLLEIHQQTPTAPIGQDTPSYTGPRTKLNSPAIIFTPIPQQTSSYSGLVTATNSIGMELIWIPSGEFVMGSPTRIARLNDEKQVRVTLTKPFYLGKYEVTQGQWQAVMQTRPWQRDSNSNAVREGRDFAATFVNWEDAMSFCRKLTQHERSSGKLDHDSEYTLPTEAQWEYACRAGSTTRYSFGDDESQLRDYAWYPDNSDKIGKKYAHQVGRKKANAWGLHDMHGNVYEWCRDWYQTNLPRGTDSEVRSQKSYRVLHGGSWSGSSTGCRSTNHSAYPSGRLKFQGFRVARVQSRVAGPRGPGGAPGKRSRGRAGIRLAWLASAGVSSDRRAFVLIRLAKADRRVCSRRQSDPGRSDRWQRQQAL